MVARPGSPWHLARGSTRLLLAMEPVRRLCRTCSNLRRRDHRDGAVARPARVRVEPTNGDPGGCPVDDGPGPVPGRYPVAPGAHASTLLGVTACWLLFRMLRKPRGIRGALRLSVEHCGHSCRCVDAVPRS